MSDLSLFLKKNKKTKENVKYAATKSLCDDKGKPLEWEIKPLTTRESDAIRDDCSYEVQVTGKPGVYRQKVNSTKFGAMLLAKSVVFPNLNSAELQDSYGVSDAQDLVREMIDDPGEYNNFLAFVQELNGFNTSLDEAVEEAKN